MLALNDEQFRGRSAVCAVQCILCNRGQALRTASSRLCSAKAYPNKFSLHGTWQTVTKVTVAGAGLTMERTRYH